MKNWCLISSIPRLSHIFPNAPILSLTERKNHSKIFKLELQFLLYLELPRNWFFMTKQYIEETSYILVTSSQRPISLIFSTKTGLYIDSKEDDNMATSYLFKEAIY